jgi:VWFA-related protein
VSKRGLALLLIVAGTTALAGQTFSARTDLVRIPIAVTDREDRSARGLSAADFRVFEDGVEQVVAFYSDEPQPLSLCIVLDSSGSMAGTKQLAAGAAVDAVLRALKPPDEVALVIFSAAVDVAVSWRAPADVPVIQWKDWAPNGETALVDAIKPSLELTNAAQNRRPVILIVSDGEDTASGTPLAKMVATRRESEVPIYAIRPVDTARTTPRGTGMVSPTHGPVSPPDYLRALVGDSGGAIFPLRDRSAATAFVDDILTDMRTLATIGYEPRKALDGKYRKIKVEARNRSLRVRHRGGYLAIAAQ